MSRRCYARTPSTSTLAGLGASSDEPAFRELVAAYREPTRHYHDLTHVEACLDALEEHRELAEHVHEVEIALWFHDAIYDSHRGVNEERSADWAVRVLAAKGVEAGVVERVRALIMATKHVATPSGADQRLLVDVDLGIPRPIAGRLLHVRRRHPAGVRLGA